MATGFDDFASSANWTDNRDASTTTWTFAAGALTLSTNSIEGLTLNAVDSDANRDDAEVLVKVEVTTAIGGAGQFIALVRGSTGGSGPNRYVVRMGGGFLRTYKYVNSTTPTQISIVTTTNFDAIGTYWVRLRVQSTTVQARIWKDGTSEPGTWTTNTTDNAGVSGTDSSITGVGWMGVQSSITAASNKKWINGFGWATAGDTAPASAGGGASFIAALPRVVSQSTNRASTY